MRGTKNPHFHDFRIFGRVQTPPKTNMSEGPSEGFCGWGGNWVGSRGLWKAKRTHTKRSGDDLTLRKKAEEAIK